MSEPENQPSQPNHSLQIHDDQWHPEVVQLFAEDPWQQHPIFSREDWISNVRDRDTQLGYWSWVSHQLELYGV